MVAQRNSFKYSCQIRGEVRGTPYVGEGVGDGLLR